MAKDEPPTDKHGDAPSSNLQLSRAGVGRLSLYLRCLEGLLRDGAVKDYAELAVLGHVTRARVSQIMSLLQLAPDIQEAILFLPRTEHGRDPIHLAMLQPIAAAIEWKKQRRMWSELRKRVYGN